jgi:drug/metabolite transporter (DMT)-like permease
VSQLRSGGEANRQKLETLALVAVGVTVCAWATSNVVIKVASTTGLITSFYRLWFAIPLLWLTTLFSPSLRARMDRAWLSACLVGGGLFGVHQILFFNSLKLTSVANVTIIGALQPALVILVAGRMFNEKATLRAVAWSLLALLGTTMVVLGSAGTPTWSPLGDVVAVANLFAFTAYFLASKRIRTRIGTSEYIIGMTTVAGFVILAASCLTGQDFGSPHGKDWLILLFIAVVPGTLGHFLTNWAHQHTSAFVMSIMLLAVPVLASVGAVVVLGETLRLPQLIGGAIVLIAIGIVVRSVHGDAAEQLAESAAATDAP